MSNALTLGRPMGLPQLPILRGDQLAGSRRVRSYTATTTSARATDDHAGQAAVLDFAEARLNALRDRGISEVAALNTFLALKSLVGTDAATPQVGIDGDGGVETEWFVDGESLILNCGADGDNVLWALDGACQLKFRHEFNARMIEGHVRLLAREWIERMNRGVRNSVRTS